MCKVVLFGEDHGHEIVLSSLVARLAAESALQVEIHPLSVRGGHGTMIKELKQYVKELHIGQKPLPDLLVVGRDANCGGYNVCKTEIEKAVTGYEGLVIPAIPDPHIERWLLLDSAAFKQVLGKGCAAPDLKCNRDRYKELLDAAVRAAGVEPLFGGLEHAAEIVQAMDLERMLKTSDLGKFLQALRGQMARWSE